jgi:hypothetical protein
MGEFPFEEGKGQRQERGMKGIEVRGKRRVKG